MKLRISLTAALTGSALFFAGCGKKAGEEAGHDHSEHAEGGDDSGVAFKPGRGLQLSPQIIKALELTTVEATEQALSPVSEFTAQVFATKPTILASLRLPLERAEALEKTLFQDAKLVRIDRATAGATRLVDLVFSIERKPTPAVGDFVTLAVADTPVTVLAAALCMSSTAIHTSAPL
jgi:hypothetical protein